MWIIIETVGGPEFASVVADEDGYNLVFNSHQDAGSYASDNCQEPIIVEV